MGQSQRQSCFISPSEAVLVSVRGRAAGGDVDRLGALAWNLQGRKLVGTLSRRSGGEELIVFPSQCLPPTAMWRDPPTHPPTHQTQERRGTEESTRHTKTRTPSVPPYTQFNQTPVINEERL
ncbi:hypothetical protein Pcinc_012366 [Petrolisthes cinctipes]|uniref:Uncharacterized protein n=1 Tax=Petrolisthes cinctipes TaxID=88211 RepID=A0AAE1KVG6_PETCI|nr:hypothetical protein Pcinc_012366 [Petrolisthes cinctipes]